MSVFLIYSLFDLLVGQFTSASCSFIFLYNAIELIFIDSIQVPMHLYNGTCPALIINFQFVLIINTVYTLFDLPIDSLFDHDLAPLILRNLTKLSISCINIGIAFSHVVLSLSSFGSLPLLYLLLFNLPGIQMFVTLQEGVLNPEHGRIQDERYENHDDYEFQFRVAFEHD